MKILILLIALSVSVSSLDVLKECTEECTELTLDSLTFSFFEVNKIKWIKECEDACDLHVDLHEDKDVCKRTCVINDIYAKCENICAYKLMEATHSINLL